MKYMIEGYNRKDYISNFVNWELLKEFESSEEAYDFIQKMESKEYKCRIIESKEDIQSYIIDEKEEVHWEIFTGV